MNREELIVNSIVELSKINEHASKFEKSMLMFCLRWNLVKPQYFNRCIYGAMTGSAYSRRARQLRESCTGKTDIRTDLENLCLVDIKKAVGLIEHYIIII